MNLSFSRIAAMQGEFRPPSDKSLTHRSYMFAAFADGPSVVRNPLRGEDCENTRNCMIELGLRHEQLSPTEFRLIPCQEWTQPSRPLDCGNSGTTIRLLSGLVASRPLDVTMTGDASLSKRPMKRIAEPLRLMGANFEGDTPPIRIRGGNLKAIDYVSPVASAQVKSCTLLAGLLADGTTSVTEPSLSRDHTERMLAGMGVQVVRDGLKVSVKGGQNASAFEFDVPGDISSAAFFLVAAALLNGSQITATSLGVNPSRTGILDVLRQAGVPFELTNEREELGEPVADVTVGTAPILRPFKIEGDLVPRLIDEIPVLAVLATQCEGTTVIRDAKEMRVKESDRIELVADNLRRMGAKVETFEDGMAISGPTPLKGVTVDSKLDHRIAMSFAIAGCIADGTTEIVGADSIRTSFPNFVEELNRLAIS
ncbi:MAG: 3-phosphoshikimate 1-carboxyvinyltransferase [Armatimonadetes bacterium]|nr:3-phosphoshikimate 1-carboxyvinyltransferase [Armatimonadota bacterium]